MYIYTCTNEYEKCKFANCSSAHLFWVEGCLQGHTDGVAEVSDAEHYQRQPLSFREVPHGHCCRFFSPAVALYLPVMRCRTVSLCYLFGSY